MTDNPETIKDLSRVARTSLRMLCIDLDLKILDVGWVEAESGEFWIATILIPPEASDRVTEETALSQGLGFTANEAILAAVGKAMALFRFDHYTQTRALEEAEAAQLSPEVAEAANVVPSERN